MKFWDVVFVVLMIIWFFGGGYYIISAPGDARWSLATSHLIPWACVTILGYNQMRGRAS